MSGEEGVVVVVLVLLLQVVGVREGVQTKRANDKKYW